MRKTKHFSKNNKRQETDPLRSAQAAMEVLIIIGVLVIGVIIFGTFYFGNIGERSRGTAGDPGDYNQSDLEASYNKALNDDVVEEVSMSGGSSHSGSGTTDDITCNNNGICDPGENSFNCLDCVDPFSNFVCGDSFCDELNGETSQNCAADCPVIESPTILVFDTTMISDGSSEINQIFLPLEETGTYNFNVDWNDDSTSTITSWNQSEVTHTYATEGIYEIKITGEINGLSFNNRGDRLKLREIKNWGNLNLGNSGNYFYGCSNLNITATDILDLNGTTNLSGLFKDCSNLEFNDSINSWDTSNVTDMSYMFSNTIIDIPLSFDTSNVTNMSHMFYATSSYPFNNLIDFNTSKVTDMSYMFSGDMIFNQPLSFDTSNVTNMSFMFSGAESFNRPLSFDTSNVTNMSGMFSIARNFNRSLSSFNTSNVTDMSYMFSGAESFNQPLNSWDVSSVTNMLGLFMYSPFDQDISSWDVSNVTNMQYMFDYGALSTANYDSLLNAWANLPLPNDVQFSAGTTKYSSAGSTARQSIIDNYNWTITDGGLQK